LANSIIAKGIMLKLGLLKVMLSVVILTKNEENNIIDCLESLLFADEIIIIDDCSKDRTIDIVRDLNSKNIRFYKRKLDNFASQRNFGLSKAKGDWVLFVDADEIVSKDLKNEVLTVIVEDTDKDGYYIRRRDFIWGRELKHGEISGIKLLRLAKKRGGKWVGKVHERWNIKGYLGNIKTPLIHRPHSNLKEFIAEINFYTSLRAEELKEAGVKVSIVSIIIFPIGKFLFNYILRLGFLDGVEGFIFAIMMSFHSFLVRGKLWMLEKKQIKEQF